MPVKISSYSDKYNKNISYVGITDPYTDFTLGTFKKTGRSLYLAMDGEGFFKVETPDGPRYTRNGNFRLNTANQLVNQMGHQVLDQEDKPVVIDTPGAQIAIDGKGNISAGTGLVKIPIGDIKMVRFENARSLVKMGDSLYRQI